jgi:glutathione S-transferase
LASSWFASPERATLIAQTMSSVILHHYINSPFAQKARMMLGFKGIKWRSVQIPNIMPKPDLLALTGGYRRTPVLQAGADIYCDTALIAELLEQTNPQPALFPATSAAASKTLAQWADTTLFWTSVTYTLQPAGMAVMFAGITQEQLQAFAADRQPFRLNVPRLRIPEATYSLQIYLERLDEMLGDQVFLFGDQPSIADFSVAHCLWFVTRGGPVADILNNVPRVVAWLSRVVDFAAPAHQEITGHDAIEEARASHMLPSVGINVDLHGIAAGDMVSVGAIDWGTETVTGALYGATRERISIVREDARAGQVAVHFPRIGFEMRRAA